jgi:hypothetical protein
MKQHIFTYQIRGAKAERLGLADCMKELKKGAHSSSGVLTASEGIVEK